MEKINLVEILKDCPKGTKLYSPLCGECELVEITSDYVEVTTPTTESFFFNPNGTYCYLGEVVLFPSKENRDWSKFKRPFKDGDVVVCEDCEGGENQIFIFKEDQPYSHQGNAICYMMLDTNNILDIGECAYYINRLATEEEKQKLFNAIKVNGYKWNAETKTLEKLWKQ